MEDHKPLNITQFTVLPDGGWFDEKNHFGVRFAKSKDKKDTDEAKRKLCAFQVLSTLNKMNMEEFGSKAFWNNLGIQAEPYGKFEDFVSYLQKQNEQLFPEVIPIAEAEYKTKCELNGVFNGEPLFA